MNVLIEHVLYNTGTVNHEVTLHNAAAYLTQHAMPDLCAEDKHAISLSTHTHGNKAYIIEFLLFTIVI